MNAEQKLRAEVERLWRENRRLEDENRALRTELASKAGALEIAEKTVESLLVQRMDDEERV